jgi:transposase
LRFGVDGDSLCVIFTTEPLTAMPALRIRADLSSEELRRLTRGESDGRVCRRLLAIAMALDGISREEAARQAGMDRQTLRDWVVRYNAEGVEGLRDRARTGRPPLLADALASELADLIATGPDIERDGVVEYRVRHIRELALRHFGADYSRTGMQDRLYRMKLSFLTPRPIHPKTDATAQEAFKKTSPTASSPSQRTTPRRAPWRSGSRTKPASARKAP